MKNPFRYFNSSPEVIHLTAMMYLRYPLSLRQVENLPSERGIDICHKAARFRRSRFVPICEPESRKLHILFCICSVQVASAPPATKIKPFKSMS